MLKHVVFLLEIRHWKYLEIIHETISIEKKDLYFLLLLLFDIWVIQQSSNAFDQSLEYGKHKYTQAHRT